VYGTKNLGEGRYIAIKNSIITKKQKFKIEEKPVNICSHELFCKEKRDAKGDLRFWKQENTKNHLKKGCEVESKIPCFPRTWMGLERLRCFLVCLKRGSEPEFKNPSYQRIFLELKRFSDVFLVCPKRGSEISSCHLAKLTTMG